MRPHVFYPVGHGKFFDKETETHRLDIHDGEKYYDPLWHLSLNYFDPMPDEDHRHGHLALHEHHGCCHFTGGRKPRYSYLDQ